MVTSQEPRVILRKHSRSVCGRPLISTNCLTFIGFSCLQNSLSAIMSYVGLILGNPSILSVAIISLIFIVSLGLFFSGKFSSNSRSKNPFATDLVRPPQPLVIDQNVRDRVLKEGNRTYTFLHSVILFFIVFVT